MNNFSGLWNESVAGRRRAAGTTAPRFGSPGPLFISVLRNGTFARLDGVSCQPGLLQHGVHPIFYSLRRSAQREGYILITITIRELLHNFGLLRGQLQWTHPPCYGFCVTTT